MTMEAPQAQVEFLALEVFKNDKPVTYHTLSRSLNIHVNVAKQVLNEFYTKNEAKLYGNSIITGVKSGQKTVKLVSNDKLSDEKETFSSIYSVHIYSIYLNQFSFSNEELALQESRLPVNLNECGTYYKNGMIKGPEVIKTEEPMYQSTPETKSPVKKQVVNKLAVKPETAKPVKSAGLTSGYVSRKNQKKVEVPSKRAPATSSGYVYKSRKLQGNQPKERVIVSNYEEDQVMEDADSSKKPENSKELEKLFESDFSDYEEDAPRKQEPLVVEENTETDIREALPMDVDTERVEEPIVQAAPAAESPEPEETVQTIDEDGYITTARKKTTTKPEPRKATRPTLAAKAKTTKNDGKKKQASLMNFFQKK